MERVQVIVMGIAIGRYFRKYCRVKTFLCLGCKTAKRKVLIICSIPNEMQVFGDATYVFRLREGLQRL